MEELVLLQYIPRSRHVNVDCVTVELLEKVRYTRVVKLCQC